MLKQILFFCVLIGNLTYGSHGCRPGWFFNETNAPATPVGSRGSGSGVKIADFPGSYGDLPASPRAQEVSKESKKDDALKKQISDKSTDKKQDDK